VKRKIWLFLLVGGFWLFTFFDLAAAEEPSRHPSNHDLQFSRLAATWDEGIPLGNGLLGALVWQKEKALRLSLDRADLWDLRPVREFEGPQFRFSWIREQVLKEEYKPVQEITDVPYERDAAPSKIPAGALQFDTSGLGEVESVRLYLQDAVCRIRWKSGTFLDLFVHATQPTGWFRFENLPVQMAPRIVPPPYGESPGASNGQVNSVSGDDLRRLGYPAPQLSGKEGYWQYHQAGWGGFSYDVICRWKSRSKGSLVGTWSILTSSSGPPGGGRKLAEESHLTQSSWKAALDSHLAWWQRYWQRSSIALPDLVLEKQWYLEQYKFGAASRRGSPPICLQAVWTADNGRIPPWKGDFHHDLNTQLSYWPCYSGNHLEEGLAYLDWLWSIRETSRAFTRKFFEVDGLNVGGVTTLKGEPMGGWAQYSLSPTTSAWLAHHFYLHWRYSRDRNFLEQRAYPWIQDAAIFLDQISIRDRAGRRQLPLSSSPEIHDNRREAWFQQTTNYDLALIRWLYGAAEELANELGFTPEAAKWKKILGEWPELALAAEDGRLLVAPGEPLTRSHRHFSHLMAIHPLGLLDWNRGEADRKTIQAGLAELERLGPSEWCGYSYAWLGNLAARARDGDLAAQALRIFSDCFCLPNSFHVNGDQSGTGKSNFTYRPFTLEGNFACAAGLQEMLLQSQGGVVRLFPAIPSSWDDVSFHRLRAEGAFLLSARRVGGKVCEVECTAEKGGVLRLVNPFPDGDFRMDGAMISSQGKKQAVLEISTQAHHALRLWPNGMVKEK
jgi:alpha-L-fucosidase 2